MISRYVAVLVFLATTAFLLFAGFHQSTEMQQTKSVSEKGDQELIIRQVQIPYWWVGSDAVSPNGKYVTNIDGKTGDLRICELITGKQRHLTNGGRDFNYAQAPVWSPDSTRLAFTWFNLDEIGGLWITALDGSAPRVLVDASEGYWIRPLDWSPDGNHILTIIDNIKHRTRDLSLVSVADRSIRTLKKFKDSDCAPSHGRFSPDGLAVAYSRRTQESAQKSDVFLLSLDRCLETPLIKHPAYDTFLEWSPNGRGVLFASNRSGTIDLWIVPIEKGQPQGEPVPVRRSIGNITSMGLTKAGAFYYRTSGSFQEIITASIDPNTGQVVGPLKKEPLLYEGTNRMPAWSPDGKHLAYLSFRPGESKPVFCIYTADTGKVREHYLEKAYGFPIWAPDGRQLYLNAATADGGGIYRMNVEGGEVTPFMAAGEGEELHHLQVSADGKWIVYARDSNQVCRILRRDARSGQEQEIYRTLFDNNTLALSPDGGCLAMIVRMDQNTRLLKVMRFPHGTPEEIRHLRALDRRCEIAWSPDGKFIYYVDQPPSGESNFYLWRIPAEGGNPQEMGLVMRYYDRLAVHPDGLRITFSGFPTIPDYGQAWVMEHFLPEDKR